MSIVLIILLVIIVLLGTYVAGIAEHFSILTTTGESQIINLENQHCHFLKGRLARYGTNAFPLVFKDHRFLRTTFHPSSCYLRLSDRIINGNRSCNPLRNSEYENPKWTFNSQTNRWEHEPRIVESINLERVKDHTSSVSADVDACVVKFDERAQGERLKQYVDFVQEQDPEIRELKRQLSTTRNQRDSYWGGWQKANQKNNSLSAQNNHLTSTNNNLRGQRDSLQNSVNWLNGRYNDYLDKYNFAQKVQPEVSYGI